MPSKWELQKVMDGRVLVEIEYTCRALFLSCLREEYQLSPPLHQTSPLPVYPHTAVTCCRCKTLFMPSFGFLVDDTSHRK